MGQLVTAVLGPGLRHRLQPHATSVTWGRFYLLSGLCGSFCQGVFVWGGSETVWRGSCLHLLLPATPNGVEAPRSAPATSATSVLLGQATCHRHSFRPNLGKLPRQPQLLCSPGREGRLNSRVLADPESTAGCSSEGKVMQGVPREARGWHVPFCLESL